MHGQLYINDERIGEANLQLASGTAGAIRLQIEGPGRQRDYTLTDGDVYVQGSRLGVRGFVVMKDVDASARSQRRPVLTTFELIPAQTAPDSALKRLAARFLFFFRTAPTGARATAANSSVVCAASRSLRTGTAAR